MNEHERIAKILTRPITQAEIHKYGGETEVGFRRIQEALLELADTLDLLRSGQLPMYKDGKLIQ